MDGRRLSELDRFKLCFTLQAARRIVDADDDVAQAELDVLRRHFPPDVLVREGLMAADTGRLTAAFGDVLAGAGAVLPSALSAEEKQDVLFVLHDVCLADGRVDPRECDVVRDVALVLELDRS